MASPASELCRISVVGPDRRADLAVPAAMPLAELVPQLRRFVVDEASTGGESWVLQRLGEAPFLPAATPRTAGWLDGEVLHLSPAEHPLPALDFDDVADALATSVDGHPDRWGDRAQFWLFLLLSVLGVAGFFVVSGSLSDGLAAVTAAAAAVLGCCWIVRASRATAHGGLIGAAMLLSCGAGAAAAVRLLQREVDGASAGAVVVAAAFGAAFVAGGLLVLRATPLARQLPLMPPSAVLVLAAGGLLVTGLAPVVGGSTSSAGVVAVLLIASTVVAPRFALRAAGVRIPQLPRSAAEMTIDVEPVEAEQASTQAVRADAFLTAGVIGIGALLAPLLWVLAHGSSWPCVWLAAVIALLAATRSREVFSILQRVFLVLAALVGGAAVLSVALADASSSTRLLVSIAMAAAAAAAAAAARRPMIRRLRPRWRHAVLIVEGLLAASAIPLLLGVVGVYAWARGLGG